MIGEDGKLSTPMIFERARTKGQELVVPTRLIVVLACTLSLCFAKDARGQNAAANNDAQIQAEVQRVMAAQGWQAAPTHEFFVYTSRNEGSCLGSKCSFTFFCAYHANFTNSAGQTVLYANQPYDDTSPAGCDVSTSPNNDIAADSVINSTSHEHMETVTDELGSAWFDSRGAEIGDKCNFNFGAVTLDGGLANQEWNTHFYIVQQEWDNAANSGAGGCVQSGP